MLLTRRPAACGLGLRSSWGPASHRNTASSTGPRQRLLQGALPALEQPMPEARHRHASRQTQVHAKPATTERSGTGQQEESGASTTYLALSIAAAVSTGVANRVLYKLALVPMGDYVFVLSQAQTFGYVLVYFGFLLTRLRSGTVSREMLDAPDKRLFVGIGVLEAASQLLGFAGASKLPGVTLPLLQQSIIIFQLGLSGLVLKKSLDMSQVLGALIVIAGVCTAALPPGTGPGIFAEAQPLYIAVFVSSMAFPALASIFKERIFADAKEKLGGKTLDLFVVNSFGSAAQAVAVLLLLPVLIPLRGLSFGELPGYVSDGISAFMGTKAGVEGAPLLPTLYISCNLAYNIALLNLLRSAGAVVQSLTNSSLTPLTILAFTLLPLPYLERAGELSPQLAVGSAILLAGLLTYNSKKWAPWVQSKLGKQD